MELIELIFRAKLDPSDDTPAMKEIVRRFWPLATTIAKRICLASRYQDDVEQAALLGIAKAVRKFDPDKGINFRAYARIVMTNAARMESIALADYPVDGDYEDNEFELAEFARRTWAAREDEAADPRVLGQSTPIVRANLSEPQRELVYWRYVEDIELADLAGAHGVSVSAVSQRLKTIQNKLRSLLAA